MSVFVTQRAHSLNLLFFKRTLYTGVVNPKPTIGKPRNRQRNVHYCMRGTKTENEKNIK